MLSFDVSLSILSLLFSVANAAKKITVLHCYRIVESQLSTHISNQSLLFCQGLKLRTSTRLLALPRKVSIEFRPANIVFEADIGSKLSEVAEQAGVEINYKCRKGECGTCEVKVNGKWVKACQSTIDPLSSGERYDVFVKPASEAAKKKPSKFFSPASFVEGVINNGLGVVGFVTTALSVDDEFEERMKREQLLIEKLEAKKAQKDRLM